MRYSSRSSRFFFTFMVLLSIPLLLSTLSCKKKVQVRDTLNINLESEPPTLDWSLAADTTSALVIDNLMDG
ncbi:MAG: hypothetical protein HY391_04170 [Deltaproteobacteria bacterium]|nr:hypothetical protein [Deltaproteobacteria bacterium]